MTARYSPQTFFRAQQDPPTEPGWYYAIPKMRVDGDTIRPHKWVRGVVVNGDAGWDVGQYNWFGSVPETREASSV